MKKMNLDVDSKMTLENYTVMNYTVYGNSGDKVIHATLDGTSWYFSPYSSLTPGREMSELIDLQRRGLIISDTLFAREWDSTDKKEFPQWVEDAFKHVSKVSSIHYLYIAEKFRGVGRGSELLQSFLSKRPDDIPVLAVGQPLKLEFTEEPSESEIYNMLDKHDRFYNRLNFVNINVIIGQGERSQIFLWLGNTAGKELLEKLQLFAKENQQYDDCKKFAKEFPI